MYFPCKHQQTGHLGILSEILLHRECIWSARRILQMAQGTSLQNITSFEADMEMHRWAWHLYSASFMSVTSYKPIVLDYKGQHLHIQIILDCTVYWLMLMQMHKFLFCLISLCLSFVLLMTQSNSMTSDIHLCLFLWTFTLIFPLVLNRRKKIIWEYGEWHESSWWQNLHFGWIMRFK